MKRGIEMKFAIENYLGKHINHVKIIGVDSSNIHSNYRHWVFQCDCGNMFCDIPCRVLSGHRKSCGCIKGKSSMTHGCNGDEFYPTWWSMMQRCYNPKNHNYQRYGARGIKVCEEWQDPKQFIAWAKSTAGHKLKSLSLDRKDNNSGYSPDNCRWATAREQSNNRVTTVFNTIDGVTMPFTYWCEKYNISPATVRARMKNGCSLETALKEPTHQDHVMIAINGVSKNISDWCKEFGVTRSTAYKRIRSGWDPVKAVSTPPRK